MRTWRVSDVMTTDVAVVREQTPYREIIDLVTARRISAVPVVDEFRHVLGVVSEADLLHKVELIGQPHQRRIFASSRRRAAQKKAEAGFARDLMTAPAVTVYGHTPLAAAQTMHREDVKRLPVIDDLGRLVGIITRGDLLRVHLRPDAEIREDVAREVLLRVLAVVEGRVEVSVAGGVVQLAGRLERRSAVQLALKLSAQVIGVVEVIDELAYEFDDTVLVGGPAYLARTTGVTCPPPAPIPSPSPPHPTPGLARNFSWARAHKRFRANRMVRLGPLLLPASVRPVGSARCHLLVGGFVTLVAAACLFVVAG